MASAENKTITKIKTTQYTEDVIQLTLNYMEAHVLFAVLSSVGGSYDYSHRREADNISNALSHLCDKEIANKIYDCMRDDSSEIIFEKRILNPTWEDHK